MTSLRTLGFHMGNGKAGHPIGVSRFCDYILRAATGTPKEFVDSIGFQIERHIPTQLDLFVLIRGCDTENRPALETLFLHVRGSPRYLVWGGSSPYTNSIRFPTKSAKTLMRDQPTATTLSTDTYGPMEPTEHPRLESVQTSAQLRIGRHTTHLPGPLQVRTEVPYRAAAQCGRTP
jgi:hypothetical protein